MATILWILAVILVIVGIAAIFRGQVLWGIVLIVVGLIVGPGGVSVCLPPKVRNKQSWCGFRACNGVLRERIAFPILLEPYSGSLLHRACDRPSVVFAIQGRMTTRRRPRDRAGFEKHSRLRP